MRQTAFGSRTIRDEEVRAGTGKGWEEWCSLIDAAQENRSVTAVARYLCTSHNLDQLWAQIIAVYYKWRV